MKTKRIDTASGRRMNESAHIEISRGGYVSLIRDDDDELIISIDSYPLRATTYLTYDEARELAEKLAEMFPQRETPPQVPA